MNVNANLVKRR